MTVVAVIGLLAVVAAFGVWALIRSAADADRQIYKMLEEQNDRETAGANPEAGSENNPI